MRKIFLILAALSLLACSDDDEQPKGTYLELSSETITVGPGRTTKTLAITANEEWTATVSGDITGLELSETSGDAGKTTITLTIPKNEAGVKRSGMITVKAGGQTATSTIEQIVTFEITGLKIGDVPCVLGKYRNRNEYFLPIDIEAAPQLTHKIEFSSNADYVVIGNDPTKVRSGDDYTFPSLNAKDREQIRLYFFDADGNKMGEYRLNITGLPIVTIVAPEGIVDEPKRPCHIEIIDPKGRTEDGLHYFRSYAGIEYRGSGAQLYPKKPYSITLRDEATEESIDAKLLGLRNDNKWILDAMWLDLANMRNRVCFDIWNEFNVLHYAGQEPKAMSGTHGYLVELFLDGEYYGLHTLSDRLDRKQLKIKKSGGYLYKTRDWTDEVMLRGIGSVYDNNSENWAGLSSDYPDEGDGGIEFKYYHDLVDFVANSSDAVFDANFETYLDMGNTVDYFIYINLVMAYDNIGRNMYWGIYNVNQSTVMFPLVWDMDGTLGRTWDRYEEDPAHGLLTHARHNGNDFRLFKRIIDENPAGIIARIQARWTELRATVLTPENLNAKVDYYRDQQLLSGAHAREFERWPAAQTADLEAEVEYIKSWYAKRLLRMDELIAGMQ